MQMARSSQAPSCRMQHHVDDNSFACICVLFFSLHLFVGLTHVYLKAQVFSGVTFCAASLCDGMHGEVKLTSR